MPARVESSAARGSQRLSSWAPKAPAPSINPDPRQATIPACQDSRTAVASSDPAPRAASFTGSITRNT